MDRSESCRRVGDCIRKLRTLKNVTQLELASRMQSDQQNISSYENGKRMPTIFWIEHLCDALGIEPLDFFIELYQE